MYKGKQTKGLEFYKLLNESEEFTSELGKVALASGKLEAELIILLTKNGIKEKYKKATLGTLIDIADKNELIDKNMKNILKGLSKQRNYISHNIYALFIDLIGETILEKENLLDTDVILYIERAWQLSENLNAIANIFEQENK